VVFTSCKSDYEFKLETPKQVKENGKFTAKITEVNGLAIDSVLYAINGQKSSKNNQFDLSHKRLGVHTISAIVFYDGNKNKKVTNTVLHLADKSPVTYKYEIVNEYPHDANAFTQGLEYHNGYLYESTGLHKQSSLRKVELETGKVLKKIDLEPKYFAEGMTIKDNKIYQLTWQSNQGFIYDLESFKFEKVFGYGRSIEGWGLTHNDSHLIKTDGTERMWFINPNTYKEDYFIETYTNKRKVDKLNELEYINGKIFANVWQKNYILIVNPKNGAIDGILDLNGLQSKAGQRGEDNVLNGIAYDKENDRLFVTGKKWNKLFEIKYSKK
jgi:glutamine cyclotransferase